ncbi:aspartic protease [Moniliophthora roreri]|nr:aspartic protease [Moniliophthora roreri]
MLGELGKANCILVVVEGGVGVLHEAAYPLSEQTNRAKDWWNVPITKQPNIPESKILSRDCTHTLGRTRLYQSEIEARPCLTTPAKCYARNVVTRESIKTIDLVNEPRTLNLGVQFLYIRRRTVHNRGTRINNGGEVRDNFCRTNKSRCTGNLPESSTCVYLVFGIGATEEELRIICGQIEPKRFVWHRSLLDGCVEEGTYPSMGSVSKERDNAVTAEKCWPVTLTPPIETGRVEEVPGSYSVFEAHAELLQSSEGIQRSAEPAVQSPMSRRTHGW